MLLHMICLEFIQTLKKNFKLVRSRQKNASNKAGNGFPGISIAYILFGSVLFS